MKSTYSFYLFTRLYVDLFGSKMEYDLEFELVNDWYDEFIESKYNDGRIDLYQCIVNYLKSKGGKA